MTRRSIRAIISLASALVAVCGIMQGQGLHDRFDAGLSSWQSFPLAQDIGYDPSVYTEQTPVPAIVRDVINEGEGDNEVGLIRTVHMRLGRDSVIRLSYVVRAAGRQTGARVLLSSVNGKRYEARLKPVELAGEGTFEIKGERLGLPETGVEANVIAVSYTMHGAALGSHSYLKLSRFVISVSTPEEIRLISPKLDESSTQSVPVSEELAMRGVVSHFVFDRAPERVELLDGEDRPAAAQAIIQGKTVIWTPADDARPGLWTIKAHAGRGLEELRVLLLARGAAKDGGGILSTERLARIKDDPAFSALRKRIHAKAEKSGGAIAFNPSAGDSIALFPTESVFAGLESYFQLINSYGDAVAWNALDYRVNGDADSLERARRALLTVAQWKTWTPPWFPAHGMQTYYGVGVVTEQLAFGYNLIGGSFSEAERERISSSFWSKSIHPAVEDYYLSNRMPTGASNHMAHSVGGAIEAWAAIDRYDANWRQKHGADLAALIVAYEELLRGLFPGDGSEAEPAGYDNFAMEGMSYGIAALDALGIAPKNAKNMADSFWWLLYARATPRLMLDTGDTASDLGSLYGFAWLAEHSGNGALRHLYESSRVVSVTEDAANLLDLVCCSKPLAQPTTEPPVSRVFGARGSIALRSGWKQDDTLFSMRTGPWMNHEHHDQGSFQIATGGQLVVAEGGYANYYRDPNYKHYFSQAPAHNTVLVDHDPFSQSPYGGRFWPALTDSPRIEESLLGASFDYLRTTLRPAYDGLLNGYERTVLYIKPGVFVIDDELSSSAPHVFTWQLHPAGASTLTGEGSVELMNSRAKPEAVLTSADAAERWKIERVPLPSDAFWNMDTHKIEERLRIGTDSPAATSHEFLESITITEGERSDKVARFETKTGRGFRWVSGTENSLFLKRNRPGTLAADQAEADADMLAVTRSGEDTHLFAARAQSLRLNGNLRLSFSRPLLISLDLSGNQADMWLGLSSATEVRFEGVAEGSLKVDKAAASSHGILTLDSGQRELRFELAHH